MLFDPNSFGNGSIISIAAQKMLADGSVYLCETKNGQLPPESIKAKEMTRNWVTKECPVGMVSLESYSPEGTGSAAPVTPPLPPALIVQPVQTIAVPSNGVVGTESPHSMLCVQHGGSEACEAENRKHGFICPKCSTQPVDFTELLKQLRELQPIARDCETLLSVVQRYNELLPQSNKFATLKLTFRQAVEREQKRLTGEYIDHKFSLDELTRRLAELEKVAGEF
jgi:putative hemolysin